MAKEKLIVTMTSWTARIKNVPVVLNSILTQTKQPDRIVLNLSEDEFPNRTIPEEVENYISNHEEIQLNWVKENTKVWKKILPTFRLYPKDAIVCVDDDLIYPNYFLEVLWDTHNKYPNRPITGTPYQMHYHTQHCGAATLDKLEYYGDILEVVEQHPEIMEYRSSDTFFNYMAVRNGNPIRFCGTRMDGTNLRPYNESHPWSFEMGHADLIWNHMLDICPMKNHKDIYYTIPFDCNKNIGAYYNKFAACVPSDGYIAIVDADTIFSTYDYGEQIDAILMEHPDVDAFTCVTNRVNCGWQIARGVDIKSNDVLYHRNFGRALAKQQGNRCTDVTDNTPMSGLFMIIKKSAWEKIGGVSEDGMLGIDNQIHTKLRDAGCKIYRMNGVYMYHWYRNGNKDYKKHLLKTTGATLDYNTRQASETRKSGITVIRVKK